MSAKLTEDYHDFLELLQKHQVEFLVCGGHAVGFYGFLRMTMDFDILINPLVDNARRLIQCLDEFGFGCVPQLTQEIFEKPGTVFSLGVQPNQIDLMTSMSSQNTHEIFENKVEGTLEDFKVQFVSYNDLIRAKREANRLKDQLDIEELFAINNR